MPLTKERREELKKECEVCKGSGKYDGGALPCLYCHDGYDEEPSSDEIRTLLESEERLEKLRAWQRKYSRMLTDHEMAKDLRDILDKEPK